MCTICYMPSKRNPITDVLRQAIADSGLSFKALERETGVVRQSLMKFARGERSLRLDMADKLAVFFGVEVTRRQVTQRKAK
jgi:plasmid maintenance system antidote protein VapI